MKPFKESGDSSLGLEGLHKDNLPRILEEEADQTSFLMNRDTSLSKEEGQVNLETLGIGKVVGSLQIEVLVLQLSKNGKTVFAIENETAKLKIIDISDNQSPKLLSFFALNKYARQARSLFLSADEKILYSSAGLFLDVIDISDLKSPKLLSSRFDNDLLISTASTTFTFLKTSIAISWDQRTLYVGGNGLQIFSVEDPKQPSLIFSSFKFDTSLTRRVYATSVATSADGKTLYFANSTVQVFNISVDPSKPVLENTFTSVNKLNSILLGKDNKTLYAAGLTQYKTIILEQIALEGRLRSLETFSLGRVGASAPYLLEKSSSESTFFLSTTEDFGNGNSAIKQVFRAYNILSKRLIDSLKSVLPNNTQALKFIPGTNSLVIMNSSDKQLNIVRFLSNYPNPHAFSLSNNTIGTYSPDGSIIHAVPEADRLYAIILKAGAYSLNIIDMSKKNAPQTLGSYLLEMKASSLKVYEAGKRAYVMDDGQVQVFDISDPSEMKIIGSIKRDSGEKLVVLDDGRTVLTYLVNRASRTAELKMMDYSDLSSIKMIAQEEAKGCSDSPVIQVSRQGIVFLCSATGFSIYNLSAPESERRVSSTSFVSSEEGDTKYLWTCNFNEERGVLFVETFDQNYLYYLTIYNLSDMKAPKLLTVLNLPRYTAVVTLNPLAIASDGLKAYFYEPKKILVIDLLDLERPKIIGQIPMVGEQSLFKKFYLSGDNNAGFFEMNGNLLMINLEPRFSLFLENKDFSLGEKYSVDLMFLQWNHGARFERSVDSDYKILKLSLSKISLGAGSYESQSTLTPFPDWIAFDKENFLLSIETKKQRDLGNYTLYSAASLKIPFEAFSFIGASSAIEDLVGSLISFGFVDNQRFLTSSFGSYDDFLIASQYSANKQKIYDILKQYYVETFTPFGVISSLELGVNSGGSLAIKTPSLDGIKVEIKLSENQNNPQFLERTYGSLSPLITEHKTRFIIEGSLSEINTALKKLVVNNKMLDCDGEIIVTDNLNPPLVKDVKNIVRYFTSNKPPRVNLDIQSQIDMVPVYTGEFATITLNQSTFIDENVESLKYKLVMNTPERHDKPSWLVFSYDLVMKITAPEQVFSREIKLLIIAENEFEKVEVPFTLKIKLSPVYILKLLIQLSPYILTIIGLYIKANQIYNILAHKRYKHPKEFFVEIEKEIQPEEIPPLWFIARENKEAQVIMQEICMKVAEELGCSVSEKGKIADYFWNLKELDTEKLRQVIEEVVSEMKKKNVALLKKALIILAFKNYTLDIEGIGAYVKVKQRVEESNCLKRFLRMNLKNVSFSENRNVVYGIMYKIKKGRLEFTGMPDQDLEGETLVVQITNGHGRILKEFWIHGVSSNEDGLGKPSKMMKSGYEVL